MGTEKKLVAACPKCGARYRVAVEGLSPEGGRLRCSKCRAVFRVTRPRAELPGTQAAPAVTPAAHDRHRPVVVLADADVAAGKAMAQVMADWGCEPVLVHDGVEAILSIQRLLPALAVLDAELPKMSGFQICELMKRNESLRRIHAALMGATYHRDWNLSRPDERYGADAYVERPQLPEALRPILRAFGIEVGDVLAQPPRLPPIPQAVPARSESQSPATGGAPVRSEPRPPATGGAPAAPPTQAPRKPLERRRAEDPVGPSGADAEGVAQAERLARIIVSDIVLYNAEKFEAGVRVGDVLDALAAELDEGRSLFAQRVDSGVRELRDFLSDELLRVAKSRGMGA
jgi:predicted Zn finger-like uncharacterized protein